MKTESPPITDEEVKQLIHKDYTQQTARSMYGIYGIYRHQGESVSEAWMHVLKDTLSIWEKERSPN